MKVYFEGGGESKALKIQCREGLHKFLNAAGFQGKMPRIVSCGSRNDAFKAFRNALKREPDECALLLVDSEDAIDECHQQGGPEQWKPWAHLRQRDNWDKPASATDLDCHLMVQCMETWFLADRATLREFFGRGFNANALPPEGNPIEGLEKEQIYHALSDATRPCGRQKQYNKGQHSFKLLELISPGRVMDASPWAKRFVDAVRDKMGR